MRAARGMYVRQTRAPVEQLHGPVQRGAARWPPSRRGTAAAVNQP